RLAATLAAEHGRDDLVADHQAEADHPEDNHDPVLAHRLTFRAAWLRTLQRRRRLVRPDGHARLRGEATARLDLVSPFLLAHRHRPPPCCERLTECAAECPGQTRIPSAPARATGQCRR